ncbi:MAG: response regulator transcription factor [Bacteriovoracia bacterium]
MGENLSLLVVDDEEQIVEFLVEEFSLRYSVSSASTGTKAWSAMEKALPDLVLLDVSMPGMSGIDLCKKIKSSVRTRDVPVLFLSARTELDTILSAFEYGADDYIEKPFRIEELKARVAAKLRKKASQGAELVRCGNLQLSNKAMSVEIDRKEVKFSSLEFRLLKFFIENANRIVKREEIVEEVWKGEEISTRTVDAHLVSVRKRIADCDHEILSMYGEGYILRPKTKRLSFLK